ncbi:MAG: hypothetical protein Q9195_002172 [Heterodermia aff. obscurata]
MNSSFNLKSPFRKKAFSYPEEISSEVALFMSFINFPVDPVKPVQTSRRSSSRKPTTKTAPRARNEAQLRNISAIKVEPSEDDVEDDLQELDACYTDQRPTTSKQPCTPKVTKTIAVHDACEPTKAPSRRKSRSRSVAAKDRSPLIPGDARMFSRRTGAHWMDGCLSLIDLDKAYMRPWDDCIPSQELSLDNLPPFFVRLRDDQVGDLLEWLDDSTQKTLPRYRVNQCWPHDISTKAWFVPGRESWGRPHKGKFPLPGGPTVPSYIDMGLPPTFMSSGKAMRRETDDSDNEDHGAVAAASNKKRKAGETLTEKVDRHGKRMALEAQEEVVQAFADKIAALKAGHKSKIDALTADLASKDAAIAELQRRNEHDEDLSAKDTEISTLHTTLQDKTQLITDLEASIEDSHARIQKLEKKHKRQSTELQNLRKKHAELSLDHNTLEDKKKTKNEAKEARKELKEANARLAELGDAVERARLYEEERDAVIARREERIEALKARVDRGKAALERCRDFLQEVVGNAAFLGKSALNDDIGNEMLHTLPPPNHKVISTSIQQPM